MIISKPKSGFVYKGEIYRIGETVIANSGSEYSGLIGNIFEIRVGEDKETENETPDIYCRFEQPVLPADIEELEKRFLMPCGDIPLDCVILPPDMLICPEHTENSEKVYVLTEEWANDGDGGSNIAVFTDLISAKAFMNYALSREMSDGLLERWCRKDEYESEADSISYKGWIKGCYCELHYSVCIEEQEMTLASEFVRKTGERYIKKRRCEDFYSQVCEWEETGRLNEEEWNRFISDERISEKIAENLSNTYWSHYWNAVSATAHTLLTEYLLRKSEKEESK